MRRSAYQRWVQEILDDVFLSCEEVWEWNLYDLAAEAKLSMATVSRLHNGHWKNPSSKTIYSLCTAVGMDLKYVKPIPNRKHRKAA